ncbi:MAG: DUF4011 domain-containing protein [Phycisphaerales bacterium]
MTATTLPEGRTDARIDALLARLLDLSLRNRLLNFRPTRQSMAVAAHGREALDAIEDAFAAEGRWFALQPAAEGATPEQLGADLRRGVLRMRVAADRCARDSIEIARRAARTQDETGANALFLAVGMLEHSDAATGQSGRAPLLLVPVEIERISREEGCRVRRGAGDVQLNAALVEFLRVKHGLELGLEELPEDEAGIDVLAILEAVRARIAALPGWAVHEEAHLALLDFRKWPIWVDIRERRAQLEGHPVVAPVLTRGQSGAAAPLGAGAAAVVDERVLEAMDPSTLAMPLPCDGSQLAAVVAAGARRSFVLQGPPGTGKSQTIANLVSNAVAAGLRVLFVAEKQVALDVVARRLQEGGLGPWMLDLHPERCGRAEFVAQVKEALDGLEGVRTAAGAPAAATECLHLEQLRAATRTVRAIGHSAYSGAARLAELGATPQELQGGAGGSAAGTPGGPGTADLSATVNALTTAPQLDALLESARALTAAAQRCAPLAEHPLRELRRPAPSADPEAFAAAARAFAQATLASAREAAEFEHAAGLPAGTCIAVAALDALTALGAAASMSELAAVPAGTLAETTDPARWAARQSELRVRMRALLDEKDARREVFAARAFDHSVEDLDPAPLLADLRTRGARFWIFGWFARRAIARELMPHCRNKVPTDREWLDGALTAIGRLATARNAAQQARPVVEARMGEFPDAATAQSRLEALERLATACTEGARALGAPVTPALVQRARDGAAARGAAAVRAHAQAAAAALATIAPFEPTWEDAPALRAEQAQRWAGAAARLGEWNAWLAAAAAARAAGAGPIAEAVAAGAVAPADAPVAAERAALAAWWRSLRENLEAFRSFDPAVVERLAGAYATRLEQSREGVAARAAAGVKARVAALEQSKAPEAAAALARLAELRALQRPRRSIRTLVRQTGPALAALKPVVLASPLSAAMHLDPSLPPFDLVVFDEASQVPLADALGALSRAGAAVVVGDSRQLPPTSFFDAGPGDEAAPVDEDAPEELESLLDEFVAARMPELMLRWHYRSRDERLIAFSNAEIYGGRLQTFPNALREDPLLGVGLRVVQGTYDRARTRTNEAEARAVVDELLRRLRAPEAVPANRSLGVVAFSIAQSDRIQDLFDEAVDADPALRATVAALRDPVMIKNLEAVQGDERATMLFSIGYGRDADGKLAMNFGPMNRAGGERRLNVAITRAQEQMLVFSTIRAGDIDASRTAVVGVRLLRDFLAFAEQGSLPAAEGGAGAGGAGATGAGGATAASAHAGRPDALEEQVARALEARGWTVDRHVGRSGYRISLALRDRANPRRWAVGVEFDGPFWSETPTVADRELLRRAVLARLGWRVERVWSAQWLKDPAAVVARIERAAGVTT